MTKRRTPETPIKSLEQPAGDGRVKVAGQADLFLMENSLSFVKKLRDMVNRRRVSFTAALSTTSEVYLNSKKCQKHSIFVPLEILRWED